MARPDTLMVMVGARGWGHLGRMSALLQETVPGVRVMWHHPEPDVAHRFPGFSAAGYVPHPEHVVAGYWLCDGVLPPANVAYALGRATLVVDPGDTWHLDHPQYAGTDRGGVVQVVTPHDVHPTYVEPGRGEVWSDRAVAYYRGLEYLPVRRISLGRQYIVASNTIRSTGRSLRVWYGRVAPPYDLGAEYVTWRNVIADTVWVDHVGCWAGHSAYELLRARWPVVAYRPGWWDDAQWSIWLRSVEKYAGDRAAVNNSAVAKGMVTATWRGPAQSTLERNGAMSLLRLALRGGP